MYNIHSLTYDPKAEKFAKKQEEEAAKAVEEKKRLEEQKKTEAKKAVETKEEEKQKKVAEELAKVNEDRNKFDLGRLISRVLAVALQILLVFAIFALGVYGASLSTNLNVHRDAPYRVLYALYGFVFFIVVIPYVLLYRWWWKGLRPRFYALIPLVPYHFDNYYAGLFLSWMSYKPDDVIADLREWEKMN